jgi:branched-chain amino acid transport system ATP-binding protein
VSVLLELSGVVAGYGGGDVLRGVDLRIEEGSLTCIVGPNGAGKSTLLRAVSGLLRPRAGRIAFRGRSLANLDPRAILGLGIVQVAQDRTLFPAMTVGENILMGAYTLRDPQVVRRRLEAVRERFPLVREHWRTRAGNLSGGQQRLVEFARAMMLEPALLLLDEPSMGLDPITFRTVFETIRSIHRSGHTVVLVEQNARSGLAIADHGVVMREGRVCLEGTGSDVLNDPEIARLFLGSG